MPARRHRTSEFIFSWAAPTRYGILKLASTATALFVLQFLILSTKVWGQLLVFSSWDISFMPDSYISCAITPYNDFHFLAHAAEEEWFYSGLHFSQLIFCLMLFQCHIRERAHAWWLLMPLLSFTISFHIRTSSLPKRFTRDKQASALRFIELDVWRRNTFSTYIRLIFMVIGFGAHFDTFLLDDEDGQAIIIIQRQ